MLDIKQNLSILYEGFLLYDSVPPLLTLKYEKQERSNYTNIKRNYFFLNQTHNCIPLLVHRIYGLIRKSIIAGI